MDMFNFRKNMFNGQNEENENTEERRNAKEQVGEILRQHVVSYLK